MSASKAKRFVIGQVVTQANLEGIFLSDLEIKMLGFAEDGATTEELAAAKQFECEIDDKAYEAKIARLLKHAYQHAKANGSTAAWDEALSELAEKDAYVIVMADLAGISNANPLGLLPDRRLLLASLPLLCFVAAAISVAITPIGTRLFPNVFARCAVIFLLLIAPLVLGKINEHKDLD